MQLKLYESTKKRRIIGRIHTYLTHAKEVLKNIKHKPKEPFTPKKYFYLVGALGLLLVA